MSAAPYRIVTVKDVCKVCKKNGHWAFDCPNKPCFLCKLPGHTAVNCEFRSMPGQYLTRESNMNGDQLYGYIKRREFFYTGARQLCRKSHYKEFTITSSFPKLHSKRIICLEVHPVEDHIVAAGDKSGSVAICNLKDSSKTYKMQSHHCLTNEIKFHPHTPTKLFSCASDGVVSLHELDITERTEIINLNPEGWTGNANTWKMFYGLEFDSVNGLVYGSDNFGFLHSVDPRSADGQFKTVQVHQKGTKVTTVTVNPRNAHMLLTCGNDYTVRLWDARKLEPMSPLSICKLPRVVNSAFFSPWTGSKILATCQDNRLYVWDNITAGIERYSRDIIHSHDFNRYLTPYKAQWDPKDVSETIFCIGRYMGEYYGDLRLHPVDIFSASSGQLAAELTHSSLITMPTVNRFHPRQDILLTASSSSIYVWKDGSNTSTSGKKHKKDDEDTTDSEEDTPTPRPASGRKKIRLQEPLVELHKGR
eukprot:GILJ01006750.1.p1 GENE.GILJ01006750.1~~GILJ01006750.1.p1  ORF type:complete len:500 (-),score=33.37 GILJ01006750.1:387-1814(-)